MQDAALLCAVTLDITYHFLVLTLCLCPRCGGVEPVAVATGYVSDVPDSISAGTVLQSTTRHSIGETLQRTVRAMERTSIVVRCTIICRCLEGISFLVPHGWVEFHILSLLAPLCLDVLISKRIEQTGTIETDGALQTHVILRRLRIGVESRLRDGHLRIDERV